jgi:hypothetical protein
MNIVLIALAFLLVLSPVSAQQVPPKDSTLSYNLPFSNKQEEFLRHRFGVGIAHAWGDDVIGNFMLSIAYAYRFSTWFEIEANVGMMNNPFMNNIIGLDPYDIQALATRTRNGTTSIYFNQTGSTLVDIGATFTPFAAPWDCVHFTAGIAVLRIAGYINSDDYAVITAPIASSSGGATAFVAFQNYYFDVIRSLPFVRVSNTATLSDRLNLDLRFGVYFSDQNLTGNPNRFGSDFIIRYASLGAIVSYRL